MNIVSFKLLNGDEVIGRQVTNHGGESVVQLEKVRVVALQPAGNGQVGIGLMPYALGQHDGVISFRRDAIIAEFDADPQFIKVYEQQTTSIQLMG